MEKIEEKIGGENSGKYAPIGSDSDGFVLNEEDVETKTVEKEVYAWSCPECLHTIECPSMKKLWSSARQHYLFKHER